jgi:hypothetical protein
MLSDPVHDQGDDERGEDDRHGPPGCRRASAPNQAAFSTALSISHGRMAATRGFSRLGGRACQTAKMRNPV